MSSADNCEAKVKGLTSVQEHTHTHTHLFCVLFFFLKVAAEFDMKLAMSTLSTVFP